MNELNQISADVPPSVREQIESLWEKGKAQCAWFIRPDYQPKTKADLLHCLGLLMRHGNRETYVMARRLKKCL